ncbi:MAG TPA: MFS transporter [Prolixibacteraceae bacterium]
MFSNDAFEVMHIRNFRLFMFYRLLMTSATLMQSVVVAWLLYNITKSVLSLGMIGLTEVIPQVSIALFAGHFVDIWDRKRIIFYTSLLMLISSIILVIYSEPSFDFHVLLGVWPIYVTIFLTGLARGILAPANAAMLGQLVPRRLLTRAAIWNSTTWQIGAVTGPALGGLVYGFFGIMPALFLVLALYLICAFLFPFIKSPGKIIIPEGSTEGIFARMKEGIHYVFNNQVLLGAFTLDMFAVLFGGAVAMLPVFASDILKVGPEGLGILRACPAIGAILMSVILTFHPPVKYSGPLLFLSVFGFGLSMIVFALSRNFYFSAFVLFLSGVFDDISVVIRASILQLFTSDEMKGRVAAVNSIFIGSSNELGAFESGVAAKMMGLIPSVVFGGVMTLLIAGFAAVKSPSLRKLKLLSEK